MENKPHLRTPQEVWRDKVSAERRLKLAQEILKLAMDEVKEARAERDTYREEWQIASGQL